MQHYLVDNMAKKMELEIGEYGGFLFRVMANKPEHMDHWESIRKKAEPLVRELIRLNEEMEGGGYKLVGYAENGGKVKLTNSQRIDYAQEKLWMVSASELKEGDKIWLIDGDIDMYIGQEDPGVVDTIKNGAVYVELKGFGDEFISKISKKDKVYRAPKDWDKKEELYSSDEYWLEQADKLNI